MCAWHSVRHRCYQRTARKQDLWRKHVMRASEGIKVSTHLRSICDGKSSTSLESAGCARAENRVLLWESVLETLCNTPALSCLNPLEDVKLLWTTSKMKSPLVKLGTIVNSSIANAHCIHLKTYMWKMVWHYLLMRLILYKIFSLTEQINH